MEERNEAPGGYDQATPAQVQIAVECGECGGTVPAGGWLWLLSRGDIEEAEEVKVLCHACGELAGCGDVEQLANQNGSA